MKVLVCGSTKYDDESSVRNALAILPKETLILCGEYVGVDTICRNIAKSLNLQCNTYNGLNVLDVGIDQIMIFHPHPSNSRWIRSLALHLCEDIPKYSSITIKWFR